MKKRIIALVLALAVLCSCVMLAGCDAKKEPNNESAKKSVAVIVNETLKKNRELDSMSAVLKMEMNMAMEGMTLSIPLTANIKAKNLNSDNVISSVDMSMTMMGQELVMQTYQEGGWAYVVMDEMKYKAKAEDMEGEMDYTNSAKDMLNAIPEELLKDAKIVDGEDGAQTVTISIDGEKFSELYGEVVDGVNSNTGTETDEVNIKDAVITITMKDDFVYSFEMSFTMEMTVEGIKTTTQAKVSLTFEDPGKEVVITPPEGYQSFEELSMGDMF